MTFKSMLRRLKLIEARSGIGEELPTLFISIYGRSVPDPDHPCSDQHAFSDGTIVGYCELPGGAEARRVTRAARESIDALQARVKRVAPSVRVWFTAYAGHESCDRFDQAEELTQ